MTAVVLATLADGSLRVFVRDDGHDVAQVAQLQTSRDVDPAALVALVSDLDLACGWANGHEVAAPPARQRHALPPVSERTTAAARGRRDRIVEQLRAAGDAGLSMRDLGGEPARYHVTRLMHNGLVRELSERFTDNGGALFVLVEGAPTPPPPPVEQRRRASAAEMAKRERRLLRLLHDGPLTAAEANRALGLQHSHETSTRRMMRRLAHDGQLTRGLRGLSSNGARIDEYSATYEPVEGAP